MEHPVLSFLSDYLTDLHIQCIVTDDHDTDLPVCGLSSFDLGLRNSILKLTHPADSGTLSQIKEQTIYHISDYYSCNYLFFKFFEEERFLLAGPFLFDKITEPDISHLMELLQIPEELFSQLQDYYYALPYLPEKHAILTLMRHVYTALFPAKTPSVCYLDLKNLESQDEYIRQHQFVVTDDPVLSMHLLEKRYAAEDSMLDAVSQGNTDKALALANGISTTRFSPRSGSELRDFKNLMITFNSLLRRTSYNSGVHPFYIDAVSGNYARMIEQSRNCNETADIVPFMVKSYCHLVKNRSMSSYSAPIRQILVTVDASLDADLSLKRFASELFLNTSYLSALFKKEVGMTLTDYVNKNRIAYAKKLLKSTTLSIQNIATQSGISDIHYFNRLFRRETGVTPREWRNR